MTHPFVMVVATDLGFRSACRKALDGEGHRVAAPPTKSGAEYFLESAYPPDVVVVSAKERWAEILEEAIERAPRPPRVVAMDRYSDETLAAMLVKQVAAALEELTRSDVEWRDELSLNVEPLDAMHREALDLLATVESAARAGNEREIVNGLERLRAHAEEHFRAEESIMELHGYPDREEHVREHVRLLAELSQIAARDAGDDPRSLTRLVLSLRSWLEGHIMTLDRAFAQRLGGEASALR